MKYLIPALLLIGQFALAKSIIFSEKKIKIGDHVLSAEIADTDEKSQQGLMYRKSLPDGKGMLFIFKDEKIRNFWMKNTFIPLSIGFFNKDKTLVDIQDMKAVKSEMAIEIPTYESKAPASYALEVPIGWFLRKNIKLGTKFDILK